MTGKREQQRKLKMCILTKIKENKDVVWPIFAVASFVGAIHLLLHLINSVNCTFFIRSTNTATNTLKIWCPLGT